ncbi:MAG: AraC family transcriptional regulator [Defluviitaleaceae bacterium]|nr:AraC family transcriptional regulator [Defluviitaleaceae bacterium]
MNSDNFIHDRRTLDELVLVLCNKGHLYIEQDGKQYDIGPNQYILLFPGLEHKGYKASSGELSYFWCHFSIWGNDYRVVDEEEINRQLHFIKSNTEIAHDQYIIPETNRLANSERVILQFRQLLDAAQQTFYSGYLVHYALSLLGLEITTNFVRGYEIGDVSATYKYIVKIMDWIRMHYASQISVTKVAAEFNYHPGYLSSVFKKYTGVSLMDYINRTKIDAAKEILLSSSEPIKQIANKIGFADEKYFMKVFKRLEGTTPSKYRNAFFRKFVNKQ